MEKSSKCSKPPTSQCSKCIQYMDFRGFIGHFWADERDGPAARRRWNWPWDEPPPDCPGGHWNQLLFLGKRQKPWVFTCFCQRFWGSGRGGRRNTVASKHEVLWNQAVGWLPRLVFSCWDALDSQFRTAYTVYMHIWFNGTYYILFEGRSRMHKVYMLNACAKSNAENSFDNIYIYIYILYINIYSMQTCSIGFSTTARWGSLGCNKTSRVRCWGSLDESTWSSQCATGGFNM